VDYARRLREPLLVADVVYSDHTSWLRSLVVFAPRGRLEVDQPVLTADGLVGRIFVVAGSYGKVQLITDRAAAVGAMVARTRRQGVVRGGGDSGLSLDFLTQRADVRRGDRVVTAGNDGVYPRDLRIGTVTSVGGGEGLFLRIELTPAVDFGLLEQVFVLGARAMPEAVLRSDGDGPP
jgi:rod shape-determining protein MreC